MNKALVYSFFAVLVYYLVHFALFIFAGNEAANNAMLLLNLVIIAAFAHIYFHKNPDASSTEFALLSTAFSIAFGFIVIGAVLRQGVSFITSIYFIVPTLERIAAPFLYEYAAKKIMKPQTPPTSPAPTSSVY